MLQPTVLSLRIFSYSHQVDVVISGLVPGYAKARTNICKKLQLLSESEIEGPVAFPNWCCHGSLQSNAMFLQNTCSCRSGILKMILLICLKFSEPGTPNRNVSQRLHIPEWFICTILLHKACLQLVRHFRHCSICLVQVSYQLCVQSMSNTRSKSR